MAGHPMQPVVLDPSGVIRFKENKIVVWLFETGQLDLNRIATMGFPADDRMQVAQLLGCSVSGYGELGYVSDDSCDAAEAEAERLINKQEHRP